MVHFKVEEVTSEKMASSRALSESSASQLEQPQPNLEHISQGELIWSKPLEPQYEPPSVSKEDLQPLQKMDNKPDMAEDESVDVILIEDEEVNPWQEALKEIGVHKMSSGGQKRSISQNQDSRGQKRSVESTGKAPGESCSKPTPHGGDVRDLKDITVPQKTSPEQIPFQYTECGRLFSRKANLLQHQRMHKSYKCAQCWKSFSHNSALTQHQEMHCGEHTFECAVCGDHFTRSSSLVIHQKIHSKEKPYQCTECRECFLTIPELVSHWGLHT
ncbi:unnamed protein product [Lepidochelys kempii]